jgi:hypothetical protein
MMSGADRGGGTGFAMSMQRVEGLFGAPFAPDGLAFDFSLLRSGRKVGTPSQFKTLTLKA